MKYRVTGTYSWRMKWISSHSKEVDEIIEADSRQSAIDQVVDRLVEDSSIFDGGNVDGAHYDDDSGLRATDVVIDEAEQRANDEARDRQRAYAAMKRFATPLFAVWEVT